MRRCGCPIWGCLKVAMQVIGGNGGECTALHSPVCLKDGQRGWRVGRCGEQLTGPFIYFLRGCDPCGSGGVLREFRGCRSLLAQPPANGWHPSGMGDSGNRSARVMGEAGVGDSGNRSVRVMGEAGMGDSGNRSVRVMGEAGMGASGSRSARVMGEAGVGI